MCRLDSTLVTLLIASGQTPDKPQHLSEPASLRPDDIEFGLQRLSDLDVLTPRPAATQGIGYFSKTFDHFEELYGKEADAIVRANEKPGTAH